MGAEIGGIQIEPGLKPERTHHDGIPLNPKGNRKSVLIQVDPGSVGEAKGFPGRYAFAPEDIAAEMVKAHKAVYVTPASPDYVYGGKLALGHADGLKPGEVIQIGGKVFEGKDIGLFDAESAIKALEDARAAYELSKGDSEVAAAMLKDPGSFAGKHQVSPFGR